MTLLKTKNYLIRLVIDTGTKQSGVLKICDERGILYGEIADNDSLRAIFADNHFTDHADEVIVEMITLFGGKRKSSHIAESILIIGEIKGYCREYNLRFRRISRSQVVSYFLKRASQHADRKIQSLMKDRLQVRKGFRHPVLKYDLWQAYALYEFAKDHNFQKWYEPNLTAPKIVLSKEERLSRRKKFLLNERRRIDKQLEGLG